MRTYGKCPACLRRISLKSRCLIQIKVKRWNGYCIRCCCLNQIRGKDCDDPRGLAWVSKSSNIDRASMPK